MIIITLVVQMSTDWTDCFVLFHSFRLIFKVFFVHDFFHKLRHTLITH